MHVLGETQLYILPRMFPAATAYELLQEIRVVLFQTGTTVAIPTPGLGLMDETRAEGQERRGTTLLALVTDLPPDLHCAGFHQRTVLVPRLIGIRSSEILSRRQWKLADEGVRGERRRERRSLHRDHKIPGTLPHLESDPAQMFVLLTIPWFRFHVVQNVHVRIIQDIRPRSSRPWNESRG